MILINCEQGTAEWKQARCGVITASKFKDAVDCLKSGAPSQKSILYAAQVAVERISGEPCDETFNSWQMKLGSEREPMARMEYEARTGHIATESGIILTDDRLYGYSTDGFIDADGGCEIKSLSSALNIIEIWKNHDISDYMHQIQGGMWISARKWIDFIMYAPQLKSVGKQLYVERIYRDDNFIDDMVEKLVAFEKRVTENEMILRMKIAA